MNMEYSILTTYISPDDGIHVIGASKAELAMQQIAPRWEQHEFEWGTYYTEVHVWAVRVDDLGEPCEVVNTRADGKKLRKNARASRFFKKEIWGTCFIKPYADRSADLGNALRGVG